MARFKVTFVPIGRTVTVEPGSTLLDAAGKAHIAIDSVCGGDGICGRCKMIVKSGRVGGDPTTLLTREEVRRGVVLACQSRVESDLLVEIPEETRAKEKVTVDRDAQRFRADHPGIAPREFRKSPLVTKVHLRLSPPTLENNLADCERVLAAIERETGIDRIQIGLKIIRRVPAILRENDFNVTALIGRRRDVAEMMDIEPGDTSHRNYLAVVDVGTSTVVLHLVDAVRGTTVDTEACFNSQAMYGREVTTRMMAAEKRGAEELQRLVVEDINGLISTVAMRNNVNLRDITGVVCSGNTAMMHLLLGLPTRNIRRKPYVAASCEPPPFRAAEVGIKINPRGLLFPIPGISGWVGGDLTAGILVTGLDQMDGVGMLVDVGTNGEIIVGNREWLVACSASAGPALEGAGVECGMIAQRGAIEKVYRANGAIRYEVIGGGQPDGICGSGIIDLIAVLLDAGIINRAGKLIPDADPRVRTENGRTKFVLVGPRDTLTGREISIYQEDIDNVVIAKAAIFAAAKIILERLSLRVSDIEKLFIAGGFGNYINMENAIAIGLFPDIPRSRILYVGNTSVWGAKLAALSFEAHEMMRQITRRTTYYDLMGTEDYVDQFRQAMFLPHTNIELFPSVAQTAGAEGTR